MDQVLSQQEIDKLLNAMNNGEIDQEDIQEATDTSKIRDYDFRRPTKLSKEYTNTLHMLFEDFAKVSGNILSTQLRTNVNMQLASIEQISYDEFTHSIPRVTLLGLIHSNPLKGTQMIEMNPQLCDLLIDVMCGGLEVRSKGTGADTMDKESFTEIELSILEEIMHQFGENFKNIWQDIVELDTVFDGVDTNPQLLQNMSPNEPVILITITVKIFELSSFINICIPYVFFEGIADKLSFRSWFDSSEDVDENATQELKRNLNGVDLTLEAILGEAEMDVADFLELEVGDVIKLDRKTTATLDTYIEGRAYYQVKPGIQNGQFAVELLEKSEGDKVNE